MDKLIFGCGYLGRRVAQRWLAAGHRVYAVTRRAERATELAAEGLVPIVADVIDAGTLGGLPAAETVLFSVGYDRGAGHSIDRVYVEGLRAVLDALPSPAPRLIYTSSTGVFSQDDGSWVDERSVCDPLRRGGRACLAAERVLAEHPVGRRSIVLRLAGLYGPGRIPRLDDLRAGRPIAAPGHGHLNLIYVDDAASVVLAAENKAQPPRLYLVSDGQPTSRRDFYRELARQLDAPPPRFEAPPPDAPAAIRAGSDKRVRNARMLAELGVSLDCPSFCHGLAAAVSEAAS